MFRDEEAQGIVLLKTYGEYCRHGYDDEKGHHEGYEQRIAQLIRKYPLQKEIIGEKAEKDFIAAFGNILRLRNILSSFDGFSGNEILSPFDFQDYTSVYNDLYDKYRRNKGQRENISDDIVFEMELVRQIEVNMDYILMLVEKYHKSNCKDKEILVVIDKAVNSSLELRSKKELIAKFVKTINADTQVGEDWEKFVRRQKEADLQELIDNERLKLEETRKFLGIAFRDGVLKTTGTDISKIMPPVSMFGNSNRAQLKQTLIEKLKAFFDKHLGLLG